MCFSGLEAQLWAMGNPWIAWVWTLFVILALITGCMFGATLVDTHDIGAILDRRDRKWTGWLFAAMFAVTLLLTPLTDVAVNPVTHFYHVHSVAVEAIGPVNTDEDGTDYRLVKYQLNGQTKQTKVPLDQITVDNGQDPKKSLKDVKTGTIKAQLTVKARYYLYDRVLRSRLNELGADNGLSNFNQALRFSDNEAEWLHVRLRTQIKPQKMQKLQPLDGGQN